MSKILEALIDLAASNSHKYKLAAAVGRGPGGPFSFGLNSAKSHPFQARWGRNPESIYFHAEIAALKEAIYYHQRKVDGLHMWVARVKKIDGILIPALAAPCTGCLAAARAFGIRRIHYTTDKGSETIKP